MDNEDDFLFEEMVRPCEQELSQGCGFEWYTQHNTCTRPPSIALFPSTRVTQTSFLETKFSLIFTVNGPYIVYMLHENEILDDWTAIKKSLTQRKIHDGKLLAAR